MAVRLETVKIDRAALDLGKMCDCGTPATGHPTRAAKPFILARSLQCPPANFSLSISSS